MQKFTLYQVIFYFLFFFAAEATAQNTNSNGWRWQYPKPQGNTLRDIFVFDQNTAIAVGDLGTVIKTTDGGASWDVQHHAGGTDIDLYSVHFTDTLNGWAAGGIWYTNKNVLVKTGDGGKTWIEVKTDTTLPYNSVYFVDVDTGFVFGEDGIVLRTTDGGSNWDTRSIDSYLGQYLDVFRFLAVTFTDKQTGFLVGAGYYGNEIYKTTDCGQTWMWDEGIITPKFYGSINDICFINKNNGFITGNMGFFAKTNDGGTTWQSLNLWEKYQKDEYQYFYSTFFTDSLTGWIVGGDYYAFILKTTDGGENWIEEVNNNDEMIHHFYKIRFSDRNNGWIMGQFGMIYKTTDAGENWISQRENNYHFNSIYFVNANTGWAVGNNGIILNTTDGGTNWFKQNKNDSLLLSSVYAIDNQNVFAVGAVIKGLSIFDRNGIVFRSNNGGHTWTRQTYDTLYGFNSIVFVNDSVGWISGINGTLLKTTDKGNKWNKLVLDKYFENAPLGKIQFVNTALGRISFLWGGTLLKTTDEGKNWSEQVVDTNLSMSSFYFVNTKMGWAVGSSNGNNNILRTTDGGNSWFPCGITPPGYNFSIQFINETTGWISGFVYDINRTSTIIKTTDSGNTWFDQKSPAKYEGGLSGIFLLNENIGWAVGDGIIKTTTGGVSGIKDKPNSAPTAPKEIELYQNYPNPFNPSTTISYQLSEFSHVTLEVYDILGGEIAEILNEEKSAGQHRVEFNANKYNLSSGVYFLEMKATNINSQTTQYHKEVKMLYLK